MHNANMTLGAGLLLLSLSACDTGPDQSTINRAYSTGHYWGQMECMGQPVPLMMEKEFDDSMKEGILTDAYKRGYQAGYQEKGCR